MKSWANSEGKDTTLSPGLIKLNIPEGNGWIEDVPASSAERTAMYYTKILPSGETTPNVIETLSIDPVIGQEVSKTVTKNQDGSQTITTSYVYDGYTFNISVEVDSVQTHNGKDAILSAWGVNVNSIDSDGTLRMGGQEEYCEKCEQYIWWDSMKKIICPKCKTETKANKDTCDNCDYQFTEEDKENAVCFECGSTLTMKKWGNLEE